MRRLPPHAYFVGSALFHYLGPSFAVLLFARVPVLGVAWLRIASAAIVFALWRRPWHALGRRDVAALGAVLAVMNACFYTAIDRLPLGTVAAIEFLPVVALAAVGMRTARNLAALGVAVGGVYLLTDVRLDGEPLGVVFAFLNAGLFALYIVLADRVAKAGDGLDGLAAAMLVAALVATPIGGGVAAAPPRRGEARRRARRHADRRVDRRARARRRCGGAGRHRRGDLVLGDPVRLRPARDGAPAARDLRAHGLAAARDGDRRRDRRARPDPERRRGGRRGLGRDRRGAAP